MDNIKIKEFKEKHINEVLELWRDTPEVFLHDNGEDSKEGIEIFLKRNRGFSFIALGNDNKIIGAVLCGHDGRRGFIHHLVVSTQYRNKGIAKQLISKGFIKLHDSGKIGFFIFKINVSPVKITNLNAF